MKSSIRRNQGSKWYKLVMIILLSTSLTILLGCGKTHRANNNLTSASLHELHVASINTAMKICKDEQEALNSIIDVTRLQLVIAINPEIADALLKHTETILRGSNDDALKKVTNIRKALESYVTAAKKFRWDQTLNACQTGRWEQIPQLLAFHRQLSRSAGITSEISGGTIIVPPGVEEIDKARDRLKKNPNDVEAHEIVALDAELNKNHELALQHYLAIAQARPHNGLLLSNIADKYLALGKSEEAIEWYEKALNESPSDLFMQETYGKLGHLYEKRSNLERAVANYMVAAYWRMEESSFVKWSQPLAKCFLKLGLYDEALLECRRLLSDNPNNVEARDLSAKIKKTATSTTQPIRNITFSYPNGELTICIPPHWVVTRDPAAHIFDARRTYLTVCKKLDNEWPMVEIITNDPKSYKTLNIKNAYDAAVIEREKTIGNNGKASEIESISINNQAWYAYFWVSCDPKDNSVLVQECFFTSLGKNTILSLFATGKDRTRKEVTDAARLFATGIRFQTPKASQLK